MEARGRSESLLRFLWSRRDSHTDRIFRTGGRGRGELINSNKSLMHRDDLSRPRKGKQVLTRKSDKDEYRNIFYFYLYCISVKINTMNQVNKRTENLMSLRSTCKYFCKLFKNLFTCKKLHVKYYYDFIIIIIFIIVIIIIFYNYYLQYYYYYFYMYKNLL